MQNRMSITGVVEAVGRAGVVADEASSWDLASLGLLSNAERPVPRSCSTTGAACRNLAASTRVAPASGTCTEGLELFLLAALRVVMEIAVPGS